MNAIGGYFELADLEDGIFPHQDGILLNTGRNALEFILSSIKNVNRIYLPYYTCEVVFEPLKKLHIPWVFYHINNQFEIAEEIILKDNDFIIANNYFGIKDAYIQTLEEKYGNQLIVDCAQALFASPNPNIKCFYSTRKFVGVADGGVAYLGNGFHRKVQVNEVECTTEHDSHLYIRKQFGPQAGFADYQNNEKKLDNRIRWMSNTTKNILEHINYDKVITQRKHNYQYLHESLAKKNLLNLPNTDTFACPMVYPFMTSNNYDLRKELIDHEIFVAKYWPNIHKLDSYEIEYALANRMVPLPCDQRYGEEEMQRIINIIQKI